MGNKPAAIKKPEEPAAVAPQSKIERKPETWNKYLLTNNDGHLASVEELLPFLSTTDALSKLATPLLSVIANYLVRDKTTHAITHRLSTLRFTTAATTPRPLFTGVCFFLCFCCPS